MTIFEARAVLRETGQDMETMRPFVGTKFDEDGDITRAWEAAGAHFVQACKDYVTASQAPSLVRQGVESSKLP